MYWVNKWEELLKDVKIRHKKIPPKIRRDFVAVPRAGIEPARVAPLVFETSASTNSATWASLVDCDANIDECFILAKQKQDFF